MTSVDMDMIPILSAPEVRIIELEYDRRFFESMSVPYNLNNYRGGRIPIKEKITGFYCFYDGEGNPLYFGQSKNVTQRIQTHWTSNPVEYFKPIIDSVRVLRVPMEEYNQARFMKIEEMYIKAIFPLFNGTIVNCGNLREWLNQFSYRKKPTKETLERTVRDFISKRHRKEGEDFKESLENNKQHIEEEVMGITEKKLKIEALKEAIIIVVEKGNPDNKEDVVEGLINVIYDLGKGQAT